MNALAEGPRFIHNRLVQAAALGLSMLALSGCGDGNKHASAEHSGSTGPVPGHIVPGSPASAKPPAAISEQYDAAYDFVSGFDDTGLSGAAVHLPSAISNPGVRSLTLKAVELKVADDAVNDASTGPVEKTDVDSVEAIREPGIKAQAIKGLVKDTYANVLFDFTGNSGSGDLSADESLLGRLLAQDPADKAAVDGGVAKYGALSKKTNAELNNPNDTAQWSADNDRLTAAWSNADNAGTAYWSRLDKLATAATRVIFRHSPKAKADTRQSKADYQKYLHHCDDLPPPAKDKCAADEAVSDAQGEFSDLFSIWAPKVKDPTQKARVEAAAADKAISDIQGGYDTLAQGWSAYVHDPQDRARIDQAYLKAAESDYKQGYTGLGDAYAGDISDPKLRAQAYGQR